MVKQRIIDYSFKYFAEDRKQADSKIALNKFFSTFLWKGTMFVNFHISGNFSSFNPVSNCNLRGKAIDSPQICIAFAEILSQPCALFESRFFMTNEISLWFMPKKLILTLVNPKGI